MNSNPKADRRSDQSKPLEIVLADDVPELRQLLSKWLEEEGHAVTRASNRRDVVRLVREKPFDLIVTDIVMPQGDGWDAILAVNRIRPTTRILAISGGAHHMPADACLRVAKGVGADAVLKKPFNRAQLIAAVTQVIGR